MTDEHLSSPNVRKMISEPQTGIEPSHWSSEGGRFGICLGLRNCFSEVIAWRTFIDHLWFLQAPKSHNILKIVVLYSFKTFWFIYAVD